MKMGLNMGNIPSSCPLGVPSRLIIVHCLVGGDSGSTIEISQSDFPSGRYDFIVNATDIYGQRAQDVASIFIFRM